MNVLLITPNLKPGGSQKILLSLLNNLNLNTYILNYKKKDNFLAHFLKDKSKLIISNSKYITFSFFELNKIINDKKIDVIMSSIRTINILIGLYSFLLGKKIKIFYHEPNVLTEFENLNIKLILRKILMKISYSRATKIIANSNDTKKDLLNHNIVKESKITVISNPVDLNVVDCKLDDRFNRILSKDKFIIISCGSLTFQKNFELLINAFKEVKKNKTNAFLVILGDGILKENLKKISDNLKLSDDILFLGNVKNPQSYFKLANLYVCSSIYEGFGLTIVEAMLLGLPIVSTNCPGGPKEILENGKKGYLVKNNDIDDLRDGILKSVRNPIKYSVKEIEDKYLSRNIAKKYMNVFNEKNN